MSRSLRYQAAEVREHLASHYVLGSLSERVRRRCERLMREDSEFEAMIYLWQQRMNRLNDEVEPVQPPERVWQQLSGQMEADDHASGARRFWKGLAFWRGATALMLVACLAVWLWPQSPQFRSVNYMAVMQSLPEQPEPPMIITAYKGDKPGRSQLHIQWNERLDAMDLSGLRLWAVDRETQALTDLGSLDAMQTNRLLTKPEWLAIKASQELLVVRGESPEGTVLFRGPCLQLSPWQDQPG
ncbi:hypothetical protein DV711_05175 [Motiliproteus coralliicola]|uniref:Anti-sigma factor n=1 Tax=Motiliproteus coralliicola TaxID=2283196 RepID=A0A369WWP6_9GAMM|nr:hypothetical protein [Motiliproteus coralliicola]RDE24966.1 hypothetical protein DV711_05175 [Motiliproteus coralliicola]